MGKHSEWRKIAKKERRRRIRQIRAKLRDKQVEEEQRKAESFPGYKIWLEAQSAAEQIHAQEEDRLAIERELQWRKVEEEAQIQWRALQKKIEVAREERARQNEIIKLEWKKEQERQEQIKEQEERELMKKIKERELLTEKTNNFLVNGGDTPEHLKATLETNPSRPPCPFFKKTSACRFYDVCSRNHIRPCISRIILIPGFFTHYSLETTENEHGSDSSLEFENYETYDYYREFFYDVIPELENFGNIKLFKACCNHEPHLRGNVYIEYDTSRAALKCYQGLNGRWYGGKQLNVEFCNIESWKTAICGLYFVNRCPKGNSCNFLHVFQNPRNLYNIYEENNLKNVRHRTHNRDDSSDRRNWRWSESPDRIRIPDIEWEERGFKHEKSSLRKRRSRSGSRRQSVRKHRSRSRSRDQPVKKHRNRSKDESDTSGKSYSRNRERTYSGSSRKLQRSRSRS